MVFFSPPRWLLKIWYRIFGEPDVTKAVSSVNKALKKLQTSNEFQAAKAETMKFLAKAAAEAAELADKEAIRAAKVADNLRNLFEIEESK